MNYTTTAVPFDRGEVANIIYGDMTEENGGYSAFLKPKDMQETTSKMDLSGKTRIGKNYDSFGKKKKKLSF